MGFIYKITNTINGKMYIGQTIRSVEDRWADHVRFALGQICNYHICRAIRKYGANAFTIEAIEEVPDTELDAREIYWIKYFDTYHNGYNLTLGGNNGVHYDQDEVQKLWDEGRSSKEIAEIIGCGHNTIGYMLKKCDGYTHEESYRRGRAYSKKPVKQYDLKGNYIQSFESAQAAANSLGGGSTGILACCKKTQASALGYQWCFEEDTPPNVYSVNKSWKRKKRAVNQYTTEGEFVATYESIRQAEALTEASHSQICAACKYPWKTAAGFVWKYADEQPEVA